MLSKEGFIWRDCSSYQCDLRQLSTKHALCSGCISNSYMSIVVKKSVCYIELVIYVTVATLVVAVEYYVTVVLVWIRLSILNGSM